MEVAEAEIADVQNLLREVLVDVASAEARLTSIKERAVLLLRATCTKSTPVSEEVLEYKESQHVQVLRKAVQKPGKYSLAAPEFSMEVYRKIEAICKKGMLSVHALRRSQIIYLGLLLQNPELGFSDSFTETSGYKFSTWYQHSTELRQMLAFAGMEITEIAGYQNLHEIESDNPEEPDEALHKKIENLARACLIEKLGYTLSDSEESGISDSMRRGIGFLLNGFEQGKRSFSTGILKEKAGIDGIDRSIGKHFCKILQNREPGNCTLSSYSIHLTSLPKYAVEYWEERNENLD